MQQKVASWPARSISHVASASAPIGFQIFSDRYSATGRPSIRSEEHTSELKSLTNLVCRLLLEKKTRHIGGRRGWGYVLDGLTESGAVTLWVYAWEAANNAQSASAREILRLSLACTRVDDSRGT